jgi:hypothetical protein
MKKSEQKRRKFYVGRRYWKNRKKRKIYAMGGDSNV